MLRVVLISYFHLVISQKTELSPSYISGLKEESYITSSVTDDPWSPVVGDTEGAPAVTQDARLRGSFPGRRASNNLVENIRKQLMRDNYDYISDDNEENATRAKITKTPSLKKSVLTTSLRTTRSIRQTHSPKAVRTTSVVPRSPLVASVKVPLKSNSPKNSKPYKDVTRLTSLTKGSHKPVNKMRKDMKNDISISKNDLLFYIDDQRLRRSYSHPEGRRQYDPADRAKNDTINNNIQANYRNQNFNLPNNVKSNYSEENHTSKYEFNQNNQLFTQLGNKTPSHADVQNEWLGFDIKPLPDYKLEDPQVNLHNGKVMEQVKNIKEGPKQLEVGEFNNKEKQSQDSLYRNQAHKQPNSAEIKEKIQRFSEYSLQNTKTMKYQPENLQINVSQSTLNNNYTEVMETKPFDSETVLQQNNQANSEVNIRIGDKRFRRTNYKRRHKKRYNTVKRLTDRHKTNVIANMGTQRNPNQEEQHKIHKNSRNIHKLTKHTPIRHHNGHTRHKNRHKKNVHHRHKHGEQSNEWLNNLRKTEQVKEKRHKNSKKQIRGTPVQSGDEKGGQPEKPNDNENSIYRQSAEDHKSNNEITTSESTLRSTETSHQYTSQKENNEDNDVASKQLSGEKLNDSNHNNDVSTHSDKQDDEVNSEHNENGNQENKNQKSEYIDSMDNEDIEQFNGRRMSRSSNVLPTLHEVDKSEGECNDSQHSCIDLESITQNEPRTHQNVKDPTSPTAKYKLLKVKEAGGSRRSNAGERQLLQERKSKGVSLIALDGAPFPQFRLPRSRRQYMDDHLDMRPPLLEQITRRSSRRRHRHRGHNNHN